MPSPTNSRQLPQPGTPLTPASAPLPKRGSRRLLAILLVLLAILALAAANRESIYDWFKQLGYTPSPAITQLADQDTMKSYTRHMFYLNRPQSLSSVDAFRQHCPENKNTIVLGCYHGGQDGIYLYNVKDPKLAGVEQVTAAHEVLHAIYERLSNSDRQALDKQLEGFYEHGLTDKRVIDEIKLYQKTEPNAVMDEMSSTFGTELAKLPPGLESYYGRYFSDRSAIIDYKQRYEAEFNRREALLSQYDTQLGTLKARIDSAQADLSSKQAELHAAKSRLDSERGSDVGAYNAGVPAYNQLVNDYNSEAGSAQALVSQYNQLVGLRNQVASQLADLDKALDTRQAPSLAH